MREWFEELDESLWLPGDEGSDQQAQFIKDALGLRKGEQVLDAPCGSGRIALCLARAGCVLTGIDRNAGFIARAREQFRQERLPGTFHVMDLRRLYFQEGFDAAFNWHGSFGYFSDEENAEVLCRLAAALRPGGRLLIDQPNRENMLRHFLPEMRTGEAVHRNRWDPVSQRVESIWTFTRDGREESSRSTMRIYTPAQFRDLFSDAGLRWETAFGSWDGAAYCRSSRRLVVVARKPT